MLHVAIVQGSTENQYLFTEWTHCFELQLQFYNNILIGFL